MDQGCLLTPRNSEARLRLITNNESTEKTYEEQGGLKYRDMGVAHIPTSTSPPLALGNFQ